MRRIPASTPLAIMFGACGLLTTLFAMGMSVVPPAGGAALYLLKVMGGAGAFVVTGAVIYARNR